MDAIKTTKFMSKPHSIDLTHLDSSSFSYTTTYARRLFEGSVFPIFTEYGSHSMPAATTLSVRPDKPRKHLSIAART